MHRLNTSRGTAVKGTSGLTLRLKRHVPVVSVIHGSRLPTLHGGLKQVNVRVEINRHNGSGIEDEALGLRKDAGASDWIRERVGTIRKRVVRGIGPARLIVAGIAPPHVEKRG